jgi:uncharacterized protein (TIRG00374 family)
MENLPESAAWKAETKTGRYAGALKAALGYGIAALCLLWVFHDFKIGELVHSAKTISWWWVFGAVVFDTLSYLCQGMRWSLLLHPVGRISILRATQAVYAGLFVNEILPMRAGEVLRTYLVSRWISARFAAVVTSILVERFFDGIWLALAFGITVLGVPLPRYLIDAEEVLGFGILAATAVFSYLVFYRRDPITVSGSHAHCRFVPIRWACHLISKIAGGIRLIGRSRFLYTAFGISLFLLAGQMLSYWFVMRACGLELSFWHGAAIFLIVHVGTAIPSAPSNLGTYQFFTVVGLTLFGIDKATSAAFSVVVFLVLTLPLWAIGLWAFSRLGLSLKGIRTEIASLARRRAAQV